MTRTLIWAHLRRSLPVAAHASPLAGASIASALIGTAWWTIAFRLAEPSEAGLYVSALAAASLAADLGGLGVGYTLVRFLAAHGSVRTVSRSFQIVAFATIAFAALVTVCLGLLQIPPLRHGLAQDTAVIAVAALAVGLSSLSDNLLMARGRESWLFAKAVVTGLLRVGLLLLLAAADRHDAESLLLSFALPGLMTALAAFLVGRSERSPNGPPLPVDWRQLRAYALQSHVATIATMMLHRVLPLLVLGFLGATATAQFGAAWIVAGLASLIPAAVAQTSFARGARDGSLDHETVAASVILIVALQLPATAAILVMAPFALPLLGPSYAAIGPQLLGPMLGGVVIVGVTSQLYARLRILPRGQRVIVSGQALQLAVVVLISSVLLPTIGLDGVGIAWAIGSCAALLLTWHWYRQLA